MRLKTAQGQVYSDPHRFRSLVAGRRFGKTFLATVELMKAASAKPEAIVWYVAPTYKDAKRIAWKALKKLVKGRTAIRPHETELVITLRNGSVISLKGADNFESLRGDGLDFIVLDEYASMKPEAWTEVFRPSLSDKLGRALFIGTPKGYNHFHQLHTDAVNKPDWASFSFTTLDGGNVSAEELHSAARDLDAKLFRQEYEATFETLGSGRVYHAFTRTQNLLRDGDQVYQRNLPLVWSLDFNITVMCSVIGQIEDTSTRLDTLAGRKQTRIAFFDEICLPGGSIDSACAEFCRKAEKYRAYPGAIIPVVVYGDPAGNNRNHQGVTDWSVVREYFRHRRDFSLTYRVTAAHPAVKDRVNAVNAALCNSVGEVRVKIDPQCKQLIADMEQVTWAEDANGNLTGEFNKRDINRTHASDAAGYFINSEMPVKTGHSVYGRTTLA